MSNIIGFSKGLYSSWFYYAPARSLFDCGEGCASFLGNKVNAVQNIFLSHDHNDHIAGLLTFIAARESGMIAMVDDDDGSQVGKPLTIYYPNDPYTNIRKLEKYIRETYGRMSFSCEWVPVNPGTELANGVVAFKTDHYRKLSLGYKVVEPRKRLKKEYAGQDIGKLVREQKLDRSAFTEEYTANSFVYTLDSNINIDPQHIYGADTWVADCTFLTAEERTGGNTHSTLVEVAEFASKHYAKNVICAHLSPRYRMDSVRAACGLVNLNWTNVDFTYVDYTKLFNF